MPRRTRRTYFRRVFAFTLVELLVVISIIGVLMAMLLPAISKVREATYVTLCLQNMHQLGISVGIYGADNFDRIAPNCTRIDGYTFWKEPYQQLGTLRSYLYGPAHPQGYVRIDNSLVPDFQWTSGLGVMWKTGAIPFTLAGAHTFWCPGERRAYFNNLSPSSTFAGPGTYFNPPWTLSTNPDACMAVAGGGWTVSSNYIYRSYGVDPNTMQLFEGPSKGVFRLSAMAPFTAVVDMAVNIYYNPSAGFKPAFTHGSTIYTGINKLNYDGHAKWFNDPSAKWVSLNAGDSTSGNTKITAQWDLYDSAN